MEIPSSSTPMTGAQNSMLAGQAAWKQQPETEGFNFMQYLLGLQAGSTPGQPNGESSLTTAPAKEGASDSLLALFAQKPKNENDDPLAESRAALAPIPAAVMQTVPMVESETRATPDIPLEKSAGDQTSVPDSSLLTSKAPQAEKQKPMFELGGGPEGGPKPISTEPPKDQPIVPSEVTYRAPRPEGENLVKEVKSSSDKDSARVEVAPWMSPEVKAVMVTENPEPAREAAPVTHAQLPEVFERVRSLAQSGGGTMTVTLNPPELGKVEIQVKARGRSVEVEMRSESAHAKGVIEGGLQELRHAMSAQDLVLSKVEVSLGGEFRMPNPGEGFRESRHDANEQRGFSPAEKPRAIAAASFSPARFAGSSPSTGRLDLRL